jgi:hypothetical protein
MRNAVTLVLILSNLLFAGLWWHSRSAPAPGAQLPSRIPPAPEPSQEVARLRSRIQELEREKRNIPDVAEQAPASATRLDPSSRVTDVDLSPDRAVDPAPLARGIADAVREALQDASVVAVTNLMDASEFEERMKEQSRRRLTRTHQRLFADFFRKYEFTDQERDRFVELLNEKALAEGAGEMFPRQLMGGAPDLTPRQQEQLAAAEDGIRQFLSDEGYQAYLDYDATKHPRADAGDVQAAFTKQGLDLREDQYTALIDVFHQANGGEPLQQTPNGLSVMVNSLEKEEMTAQVLDTVDDFARRLDAVVAGAEPILDDPQMDALRTYFDDIMATKERQEEMTQSVLSGLTIVTPDGAPISSSVGVQVFESSTELEIELPMGHIEE